MKTVFHASFRIFLFSVGLFCLLFLSQAKALNEKSSEKILSFVSDINIHADASADITETIKVVTLQQQIRHGIYRLLLTNFRDSNGKIHKLSYHVEQVYQDAQKAPFFIKQENGGLAIYVGSHDHLLQPGTYTYVIKYQVKNVVTFLQDEDEFYWNITGTQWSFPIEKTEAHLHLPEKTTLSHYTAYTGSMGERGRDFAVSSPVSNEVTYVTTKVLQPGEGLTIAVAWPKGTIQVKSPLLAFIEELRESLFNDRDNFISLQILVLLLFYYVVVWYKKGRDPRPDTIIPLFEPPQGLAPSSMRYLAEMGYDDKVLSTALVSLATAGLLTIRDRKGELTLIQKSDDWSQVSEPEQNVKRLFAVGKEFKLSQINCDQIKICNLFFHQSLAMKFNNLYFVTHSLYLIPGFIVSTVALVIALRTLNLDLVGIALSLGGIWLVSLLLRLCIPVLFTVLVKQASLSRAFPYLIVVSILLSLAGFMIFLALARLSPLNIFLLMMIVIVHFVFSYLLKAYTPQGRKLMDKVEGFKMFLETTEQDRLEKLHPPEKTPALFEKYLPYALALDVENSWSEQFTEILKKASLNNQGYQPSWYEGRGWMTQDIQGFSNSLNKNLTSALAASTTSTGSSTPASDGRGSSGGGGGGGGGGGW